jgi:hypothetical protein
MTNPYYYAHIGPHLHHLHTNLSISIFPTDCTSDFTLIDIGPGPVTYVMGVILLLGVFIEHTSARLMQHLLHHDQCGSRAQEKFMCRTIQISQLMILLKICSRSSACTESAKTS